MPIEITIDPSHSDDVLEFQKITALVMTKRLLKAFQEGGVDNLDVCPAVIRNHETGFETHDYVACKLIGLVKAADLSESKVWMAAATVSSTSILIQSKSIP